MSVRIIESKPLFLRLKITFCVIVYENLTEHLVNQNYLIFFTWPIDGGILLSTR